MWTRAWRLSASGARHDSAEQGADSAAPVSIRQIADVPAVFVGDKLASRIPMKRVHGIAALAAATLLGAGGAVGF
jgi:hypothetical protein